MPIYYKNRETGKLEAKYVGCDTQSTKFRDGTVYERFESEEDLPLEVQPKPATPQYPEETRLQSPDGHIFKIKVSNSGKIIAEKEE